MSIENILALCGSLVIRSTDFHINGQDFLVKEKNLVSQTLPNFFIIIFSSLWQKQSLKFMLVKKKMRKTNLKQ